MDSQPGHPRMGKWRRILVSAIAGLLTLAMVLLARDLMGLPRISHGPTSPGFLGAVAAIIAWLATGRRR
jgi:hypothetical protein